jgi:hypothetical protein
VPYRGTCVDCAVPPSGEVTAQYVPRHSLSGTPYWHGCYDLRSLCLFTFTLVVSPDATFAGNQTQPLYCQAPPVPGGPHGPCPSSINRPPGTSTRDGRLHSRPSSNRRQPETHQPLAEAAGRSMRSFKNTCSVSSSNLSLQLYLYTLVSDLLPRSCIQSLLYCHSQYLGTSAQILDPQRRPWTDLISLLFLPRSPSQPGDTISRPPLLLFPAGL